MDSNGVGLAPTHTKKGARRYRYYVGQGNSRERDQKTSDAMDSPTMRWPAPELEEAVLNALTHFLTDPSRVLEAMGAIPAQEAHLRLSLAADQAKHLVGTDSAARSDVLRRLVSRITIHPDRLHIAVRVDAIGTAPGITLMDAPTIDIEVPVERKRCGKAVRLIVRRAGQIDARGTDRALIGLLAKAHEWFAKLTSGDYDSILAIAKRENLTRAYVTKVIHLAFLSPDILERIVQGKQPVELNARRLIRMGALPLAWDQQRALLGMAD